MKNILIIYPHWPPSNLAGVHRPRLIANNLIRHGWKPIILTVGEHYYEETLDGDLTSLVKSEVEVHKVKALPITRPRIIGDIGLRAFPHLYKKARKIISTSKIDFIWIPIPSFYTALLGPLLYRRFKIPYGIDYIDPWIRDISGRRNLRSMLSQFTARILEPMAIRKASLISGVSEEYFLPAIRRNFPASKTAVPERNPNGARRIPLTVAMPYGFDEADHAIDLPGLQYPWIQKGIKAIVYAGAILPNSGLFLSAMFESVSKLKLAGNWSAGLHFYFIGCGREGAERIRDLVVKFDLEDIVGLVPERKPYLWVLNALKHSFANMVIGSTEAHYTPSKLFQNLLSGKPVICIAHSESSAIKILNDCNAAKLTIQYSGENESSALLEKWLELWKGINAKVDEWAFNPATIQAYSADNSARMLIKEIDKLLVRK